ncbi:hypothetical protein L218DRAFT_288228 [Marasmius fiardii PR-910]|nr:hypothetical protein L218DRAFT_288228 [Marasmius fiardii PR-910]
MSRFTVLSYNLVKSCCRAQQPQLFQAFHSSAARNGSTPKPRRNKSRKLSSLQPTPFVREELPHSGLQEKVKVKVTGFRRRSGAENKRDWMRRTGRWGDELEGFNSTGPGSSLMQHVKGKIPDVRACYSNRSAAALSQKSEKYKKYAHRTRS